MYKSSIIKVQITNKRWKGYIRMDPETKQNLWQPQKGDAQSSPPPQSTPQTPATQQQPNEVPGGNQSEEIPDENVSWEASESIHHERDGMWFIGFIVIIIMLIGLSVWLQQWTFTALIVIMAASLIVYTRRPPRTLRYSISHNGLHVGQQFYDFDEFRSFGVLQEGDLFSVMLMPTKRFGQAMTIYFGENDGEKIVDILGAYLPMEDLQLDFMDSLLRRLRL